MRDSSVPLVARLRRGRHQPRARRRRGRARLHRPALLRRRLARPARRDVHRQPQPGAVQRHQDVPGRRRAHRAGLRPGHDPRVGRARQLRPRPRPGRRGRAGATSSPSTPPTCAPWSTSSGIRPLKVVVDAGNGMGGHTVPVVARRRCRWRSSRCTSSSTARSPTTRPTRWTRPTWSTCRRPSASTAPTSAWPSTATPTACFVVDERGEPVCPSAITALVAVRELAKGHGTTIIHNLITSQRGAGDRPRARRRAGAHPGRALVHQGRDGPHRRGLRRRALRALLLPRLLAGRHRHARRDARARRARRAGPRRCRS